MTLVLLDGSRVTELTDVVDLVAADASGQFGIRLRHEPLVTCLAPGLVVCRLADGRTRYVASAGGPFFCAGDVVRIVSARFIMQEDEATLTAGLDRALTAEHDARTLDRQSRAELERALMRRLREWSERAREA